MAANTFVYQEIEVNAQWENLVSVDHPALSLATPIPGVDVHLIENVFSVEECSILSRRIRIWDN